MLVFTSYDQFNFDGFFMNEFFLIHCQVVIVAFWGSQPVCTVEDPGLILRDSLKSINFWKLVLDLFDTNFLKLVTRYQCHG